MKEGRFNRLMNSQSPAAKKVYEAVPIQEEWDSMTINRELYRMGTKLNFQIVEGCLNTLKEAKLIKEVGRGKFTRVPIESLPDDSDEPSQPIQEEPPMSQVPPPPVPKPQTPFDVVSVLIDRANEIQVKVGQLKLDIEHAALTIAEMGDKDAKELEALRQWKKSLKNLMSE